MATMNSWNSWLKVRRLLSTCRKASGSQMASNHPRQTISANQTHGRLIHTSTRIHSFCNQCSCILDTMFCLMEILNNPKLSPLPQWSHSGGMSCLAPHPLQLHLLYSKHNFLAGTYVPQNGNSIYHGTLLSVLLS